MSDNDKIAKLKEEIANLEKQMNHDHFSSVVDKARNEKQYARLKKLKKELKELEAGG
jgi:predicted amino acid-binding ACT domain protein